MPSIIANITVATIGRVINTTLGIIITAILARLLGSANYGVYSVLLSFGIVCQIAADFGLYLALTQKLGQASTNQKEIIAPIFTLRLGLLLIGGVIGGIAALFIPSVQSNISALAVIYGGLVFQSISQLCMGIYQSRSSITAATIGDTIGRVAQLLGLLYFLLPYNQFSFPVLSAATIFTIGTCVALVIHLWYLPSRKYFTLTSSSYKVWQTIRESWPLAVMLLLNTIYFRIDMIMLPFWRDAAEIGLYALSYRLIENTLFFPAMIGGLLLPHLSAGFYEKQTTYVKELLSQSIHVVAVGAVFLSVIFIAASSQILTLIAGPQFQAAAPLLQILTLAMVVMFFGNIFGFTLVAKGQNRFLLKLYLILVVVNIIGNVFTIPILGAQGAALMTLFTEIIACGAAAYKVVSDTTIKVPRKLLTSLGMYVLIMIIATQLSTGITNNVGYLAIIVGIAAMAVYALQLVKWSDIPLLLTSKERRVGVEAYDQNS